MITLEELIDWLKAEEEDSDLIEDLLEAAVAHVENETGMRFGTSGEVTETITWGGWPLALRGTVDTEADFTLERWTGETWETLEASAYYVDGAFVRPTGTFSPLLTQHPIRYRATYTTGYVEGLQPAPVRLAVRMLVAHWYENRGFVLVGTIGPELKMGVDRLLAPYRRVSV